MASVALHQTRSIFSALHLSWKRPLATVALLPTFMPWQKPFSLALPTLRSLLDLLPPIILAVPKSKVSHSRKAMRSANKGLKDKRNIVNCPACGEAKLAHHACGFCFTTIMAKAKRRARSSETQREVLPEEFDGGEWADIQPIAMIEAPKGTQSSSKGPQS